MSAVLDDDNAAAEPGARPPEAFRADCLRFRILERAARRESKPAGQYLPPFFWNRHASAHIASRPRVVRQPSTAAAREGSA